MGIIDDSNKREVELEGMLVKQKNDNEFESIKVTERGWVSPFDLLDDVAFSRNTLLECRDKAVVVGTVGLVSERIGDNVKDVRFKPIRDNKYYETRCWLVSEDDENRTYKQIGFDSPWFIEEPDAKGRANSMHDTVVREIKIRLLED